MSSALVALVTARKSTIRIIAAPPFPRSAAAAAGAGRPAETSAAVRLRIAPSLCKATADKPRVVLNMNGIANHARPPRR